MPDDRPAPLSSRLADRPGRLVAAVGAGVVCLVSFGAAVGAVPGARETADRTPAVEPVAELAGSERLTAGDGSGPTPTTDTTTRPTGPAPDARAPGLGSASASVLRYAPRDVTSQQSDDEALPRRSGHGRRIVFSESRQRVWLVNDRGRVVRTYPVSGSRYDNLDPGRYEVYSMSRHATAYNYRETMRYMVRFTQGESSAIGFHDIPRLKDGSLIQTRDELGTPLSSGCIRQWKPDARALWDFASVGTDVAVVA